MTGQCLGLRHPIIPAKPTEKTRLTDSIWKNQFNHGVDCGE
ncbi:hypothetical protein THTE_1852 [Thermogutta terrifontis]|uniref:Uncharacterized protein n=1 Tax=Thermogutta terrifontis TaxID=1331910 RepID=A0A286RER7_9BACT|nr:hypothetical protein THTE_1852 [Thermogutta terrifontis]